MELYQTLKKEHLDPLDQITNKEWEKFVELNQNEFANQCSETGQKLFLAFKQGR